MKRVEYIEWCQDFTTWTDALREQGYTWAELADICNATHGDNIRAMNRRAEEALQKEKSKLNKEQ